MSTNEHLLDELNRSKLAAYSNHSSNSLNHLNHYNHYKSSNGNLNLNGNVNNGNNGTHSHSHTHNDCPHHGPSAVAAAVAAANGNNNNGTNEAISQPISANVGDSQQFSHATTTRGIPSRSASSGLANRFNTNLTNK